ncbi:MAG: alpha/beta hydrolase [Haloechinothrix sp.]
MRELLRSCLAVATISAAVTACTFGEDPGSPDAVVTESNGPAGPVPDGLDRFYAQSMTWGACASYATTDTAEQAFGEPSVQCARLTVPLDYAEPEGETITIGVLRKKAADPDQRIGSLVMNPGGPGGSGMVAAAFTGRGLADTEVGERFDLVGFDPRGVGASEPAVRCLTGKERDADRADDSETDGSPEGVAEQEADEREFAEKCVQRTEHGEEMLANLGTRDVVQDIDVLRSALGDEQLSYLGYSYGTRIGYSYAEAFPRNVRALLLDGALDPEQDLVESLVAQGEGFGVAFREFAGWCAARQDCALGSDKADATEEYQDLVQPLIDRQVSLADGRQLSFEDASTATVQALYSEQLWEVLNSGLNELKRGRGDRMMLLADTYNERDPDGSYSSTQDAFTAIRCVDDPPVTDRSEIREAQRRYAKVAPFLDPGTPAGDARDACAFWPVPHTSQPRLPDVAGVPPTLVISTTNDPATPYQAGVRLAKALDGALLTFEGNQHTIFAQGNRCVDDIGVAYLVDGTLPPEGERC